MAGMYLKEPFLKFLVTFAMAIAAALSGYYAAYAGLRVALATKAEERYVAELDIRLARLEATINERFATRDDLANFRGDVMARLLVIETLLSRQTADVTRTDDISREKSNAK
jgi:hypothetical protein